MTDWLTGFLEINELYKDNYLMEKKINKEFM